MYSEISSVISEGSGKNWNVIPYISPNTNKYTKTKAEYTINADISNWNMENNYYMKTIKSIDFFFIDTSILQPSYSNLDYKIVKINRAIAKLDIKPSAKLELDGALANINRAWRRIQGG